jgi:hypothetical protein
MDKDIARRVAELSRNGAALAKLLGEIDKLDVDRATNLTGIFARLTKIQTGINVLKTSDTLPLVDEWVKGYSSELQAFRDGQLKRFGTDLQRSLQGYGLELKGHLPVLQCGVFRIEVDQDNWKATIWYGPQQERLETCALSPAPVANLLDTRRNALGTRLEAEEYLSHLQRAVSAIRLWGDSEGMVPIVPVLNQMTLAVQSEKFKRDPNRQSFSDYGRADFSMDLLRHKRDVRLKIAVRALSRRRDDFIWVPRDESTGEGDTYSHIGLTKEAS